MPQVYTQLPLADEFTKRCSGCGRVLSLAEFYRRGKSRDGYDNRCKACVLAYQRDYYRKNAEAIKERARRWNQDHPDRKSATNRRWRQENQQRCYENRKRWFERNPERAQEYRRKWLAKNPDWIQNYHKRYRQENILTRRLYYQNYRARKLAVLNVAFTAEQLSAKVTYWGCRCWICGGPYEALDHVIPVSKGGPNCLANLRPACISCNSRKADRWPFTSADLD